MPENLGFGLSLDLGTDELVKAGNIVSKTLKSIYDKSVKTKKSIKSLSKSLKKEVGITESPILQPNKTFFEKTSQRLRILNKRFKRFGRRGAEAFEEVGDSIKKAKFRLAAFTAAVTDLALMDTRFARLNKTANFGVKTYVELMAISMKLSNELGVMTGVTEEALAALSEYGKNILTTEKGLTKNTKAVLKNAIMMEKAWNVSLAESISLFDDLNKHLGLTPRASKKYVEGLKAVSKATGTAIQELMELSKQLIASSKALRGFINEKTLKDSTRYAGLLKQMGGEYGTIFQIWEDLQAPQTIGNWAELLGFMGMDPMTAAAGNMKDLGLQIGRTLKTMDSPVLKAQLNQLGLNFLQQQALIEAYEKRGELEKGSVDLTKDYNEVMGTLSKTFKRILIAGRKFYMFALIPIIKGLNLILTPIAIVAENFITLFGKMPGWIRLATGLGLALALVGKPLLVIGKSVLSLIKLLPILGIATGPILLIVGALTALAGAIIWVKKNWSEFGDSFMSGISRMWKGMKKFGEGILDYFTFPFRQLKQTMSSLIGAFKAVLEGDLKGAMKALGGVLEIQPRGFAKMGEGLKDIGGGLADAFVPVGKELVKDTKEVALAGIKGIKNLSKSEKDRGALKDLNRVDLTGLYSGASKFFVDKGKDDTLEKKQVELQEKMVTALEANNKILQTKGTETTKIKTAGPSTLSDSGASQINLMGMNWGMA